MSLRNKGLNANVYVGMRYWHPYTEEALEQIKRDNVGRLVILPLYPQFSISTSGSSLRLLVRVDGGLNSTSRGAAAAGQMVKRGQPLHGSSALPVDTEGDALSPCLFLSFTDCPMDWAVCRREEMGVLRKKK